MADQPADAILDAIRDLGQCLAGLDVPLCPLANLPVGLGSMAVVDEEIGVEIVQVTLFFVCGSIPVLVDVLDFFAGGVVLAREEVGYQHARGIGLGRGSLLLLPGLSLLVLLLLGSFGCGISRLSVRIVVGFVS